MLIIIASYRFYINSRIYSGTVPLLFRGTAPLRLSPFGGFGTHPTFAKSTKANDRRQGGSESQSGRERCMIQ